MPTVNDGASVTTSGHAVWRTCVGCGLASPLPAEADKCPGCERPISTDMLPAKTALDIAYRYADTVGRIRAWADMPGVSDATRLDNIKGFLADLDRFNAKLREGAWGCP